MASGGGRPNKRRFHVDGHTFWRADAGGRAIELTTATGIELDSDSCRWTVNAPGARAGGEPVESESRDVRLFMDNVLRAMQRATHRAIVRPVPKPARKPSAPVPANAPAPCPLCRGEAWPDCELCDGSGVVTQRRADEWRELHGD
jgi:hypothetical protein